MVTPWVDRERIDLRRGMLAGILGGLVMLVVLIVLRELTGVLSFIDAVADGLLLYLPMGLFSLALDLFGSQAKTLLLVGLFVVLLLLAAWIGRSYARQTAGARRVMWARLVWVWTGTFAFTATYTLFYGSQQSPGEVAGGRIVPVALVLIVATGTFAATLGITLWAMRRQDAAPGAAPDEATGELLSRRRLTTRASLLAAAGLSLLVIGRDIGRVAGRKVVGTGSSGTLTPAITPTDDFYVISKNFLDPDPERGPDWKITVGGAVERELTLTRSDLEALVRPEFVSTLTCISNSIGGPLISTGRWTGAPLAEVLRQAGVRPGAVDVEAEGEDGYMDSIPIERAMAPEPTIVWALNGESLPRLHGTPVRLIVPGLYGIKNVKWLTTITVVTNDARGFWQDRGWTDTAIIKTSSRIDLPQDKDVLEAGTVEVGGIAFAGDRGIRAVELSTDGGDTWQPAGIVENPSPAGLSWVTWKTMFTARPGAYTLKVRATDGTGEVQTEDSAPELPDGASGWHAVTIGVA